MAYEWCSVICESYPNLADGDKLLFLSLEIGFRHLDHRNPYLEATPTYTEHQNRMIGIVFESGGDEVAADLLHALTSHGPTLSLDRCTRHLLGLLPASQRFRRLMIRSIELIGPREFEEAGAEEFLGLLNHLHVGVEDMDREYSWGNLLIHIIQHPEGVRRLSHPYWELLVELSFSGSLQWGGIAWNPDVMRNLMDGQEWDKLESWMCLVWMIWPPEGGKTTGEGLESVTLSLFRQRPSAVQKLVWWVERWNKKCREDVPGSFRRICDQARLEQQDKLDRKSHSIIINALRVSCIFVLRFRSTSFADEGIEETARSPPPRSPSTENPLWASLRF